MRGGLLHRYTTLRHAEFVPGGRAERLAVGYEGIKPCRGAVGQCLGQLDYLPEEIPGIADPSRGGGASTKALTN
jgi:hypothetical protein